MGNKTVSFETFRNIGSYEKRQWTTNEPSCWNGVVAIQKYRVTIELVDEPKEVLAARLLKLWRECDNHHHWVPLAQAAKQLGIELPESERGKDREGRYEKIDRKP